MDFQDKNLMDENEINSTEGFANNIANPSSSEEETNEDLLNEDPIEKNENFLSRKIDGAVKEARAVASKKILSLIFKHPLFWIVLGVGLLIFIAILIYHMDFDLNGIGEIKPEYYENFTCDTIYLTWEDESYTRLHSKDEDYQMVTDPSLVDISNHERYQYETYGIDEYITGIVWTDNNNAMDVDNEIVYQAMAIAARSRLIANLPDNCVVLKYFNEQAQSFTKLEGTEEKYGEISSAIRMTQGIIIGRDKNIISALYEPFSYTEKRNEDDERGYFYHMINENEESEQVIPAEWVADLEISKGKKIPKVKESHTKMLESMSLYGAKYLLEKVDSQYELYRILETYYGRDIEYYTISESFLGDGLFGASNCMWWPVGNLETSTENGIMYSTGDPYSTNISSGFGNRNAPTAGASTNHQAVDISGNNMDGAINIVSVADGTVIAVNTGCVRGDALCGGGLGNYVKIQHNDGTVTRYGHMHTVYVSNGDKIKQGQVIGLMGSTGTSTGVHLDFQILVNGTPVNPLNYISATNPRNSCLVIPGSTGNGNVFVGGNDFITWISSYAVEDMHSSNILASITIAQAILESNWGKSTLSAKYNNFFGMKAGSSWNGKIVNLPTTECNNNDCYKTTATWRVYDNALASIKDHSRLLSSNRYKGVVGEKNYTTAIENIKNGGYATDPNYVSKITDLIRKYGLDQYDRM